MGRIYALIKKEFPDKSVYEVLIKGNTFLLDLLQTFILKFPWQIVIVTAKNP